MALETPANPTPIQTKPQSKGISWSKVIVAVVVILVVAGLIGVGVWYYVDSQTKQEVPSVTNKISTESAKTSTPSAQADETADWKTFTSKKIGYSTKLPKSWLTTVGAEDSLCSPNIDFLAPKKDVLGLCASEFGGMVVVQQIDQKFDVFVAGLNTDSLKNANKSTTTVDGKQAVKISGVYNITGEDMFELNGSETITYYINQDEKVLSIGYLEKPSWPENTAIFELIVSTFKFLD
ncbi:MAG: PsbP-related protein [bacterium]|nr:PsbP-related protein [bacterium]